MLKINKLYHCKTCNQKIYGHSMFDKNICLSCRVKKGVERVNMVKAVDETIEQMEKDYKQFNCDDICMYEVK